MILKSDNHPEKIKTMILFPIKMQMLNHKGIYIIVIKNHKLFKTFNKRNLKVIWM